MAGGLEFFVDGKGLDDMPSINQVQYTTLQGAQPVTMIGKPLDSKSRFELELPRAQKCLTKILLRSRRSDPVCHHTWQAGLQDARNRRLLRRR